MIKEAMDRLLELATPTMLEVEGRPYSTLQLTPIIDPRIKPLEIHTLTGIVDYLERTDNDDRFPDDSDFQEIQNIDEIFIHIISHDHLDLYGTLMDPWKVRNHYLSISLIDDKPFPFGKWLDLEEAIIELQSKMVPDITGTIKISTEEEGPFSYCEAVIQKTDLLPTIQLLSSVTECNQRISEDNGISQSITIQKGIRNKEQVEIANVIQLRPFRTFREIEQPSSFFVRRIRQGAESPRVAFFEADGGAWKLEAIQKIKSWLSGKIPGVKIIA